MQNPCSCFQEWGFLFCIRPDRLFLWPKTFLQRPTLTADWLPEGFLPYQWDYFYPPTRPFSGTPAAAPPPLPGL